MIVIYHIYRANELQILERAGSVRIQAPLDGCGVKGSFILEIHALPESKRDGLGSRIGLPTGSQLGNRVSTGIQADQIFYGEPAK